jgi:hypothetical protein
MKGLKAQIRLDQMDRWLDSQNVVINAAKLILPIERDPAFAPIPKIQLRVDNSLYYNSQILDDKSSYKIFITSFLRDFINKKKKTREYVFELITPANNTYINRSIIKADEISLDIIYTKYR